MRKLEKQKYIKIGIVAIGFIVVLAVTFVINRAYIRANTDMVSVAIATKKISAFSEIKSTDVTLAKRPRSMADEDTIIDLSVLKEQAHYTQDLGFGEGDIIKKSRLTTNRTSALGRLNQEGKMLVAINTNLVQSCANFVVPGTVVNAIVFIKSLDPSKPDEVYSYKTKPELANLLVIDKKNAESAVPPQSGREAIPAVVTIELPMTDAATAEALVKYNELGSIYLLPVGFDPTVHLQVQNASDKA